MELNLLVYKLVRAVLSIEPGTRRSSGGYSVESQRVYLTFKNSPERNSPGLLILLRHVLFRGSHLLQILLKALQGEVGFILWMSHYCREFSPVLAPLSGATLLERGSRDNCLCMLPLNQSERIRTRDVDFTRLEKYLWGVRLETLQKLFKL